MQLLMIICGNEQLISTAAILTAGEHRCEGSVVSVDLDRTWNLLYHNKRVNLNLTN